MNPKLEKYMITENISEILKTYPKYPKYLKAKKNFYLNSDKDMGLQNYQIDIFP